MSFPFRMDKQVYDRIQDLGFNSRDLPHENVNHCDLCGGGRFQIVSRIDRYGFSERFVLCRQCGLVFLNPRPTSESYNLFYEKYYRKLLSARLGKAQNQKLLMQTRQRITDLIFRLLDNGNYAKLGMKAVDIGGSTSILGLALRQMGISCLVLDPSPIELDIAHQAGLETELGTIDTYNFGDRTFDLVFLIRTIEHTLSVKKALEKIHDVLNSEGIFITDIVDFEHVIRTSGDYRNQLKVDHCYYLTDQTLRAYLKSCGFEIILDDITEYRHFYVCRKTQYSKDEIKMERHSNKLSYLFQNSIRKSQKVKYPSYTNKFIAKLIRMIRKNNMKILQ